MKKKGSLFKKNNLILLSLLWLFWIILSPSITAESIIIGLIISFGIMIFSRDLVFTEEEVSLYKFLNFFRLIPLLIQLIIEIIKSNIHVAKIVLSPSLPISPKFVRVPVKLEKDFNKVIYGNAITLTPGTITIDITDNEYLVHVLTEESAKGLNNSSIEKQVMKLEGE